MIYTYGRERIEEDQVLRIAVEERLKDELSIRNWYATTGRSLGWTFSAQGYRTIIEIEHRARLRLLVSMMRSVRKATR